MEKRQSLLKTAILSAIALGIALLLPEAMGESKDSDYLYDENSICQEQMDMEVDASDDVYICTGPQSKRYHKTKSCKGLSKCSTKIIQVSIEEATDDYYRTPCGYCYK